MVTRVFHSFLAVITPMIVEITVMKQTIAFVIHRMNLHVKVEVASKMRGFVMGKWIVLIEVMKFTVKRQQQVSENEMNTKLFSTTCIKLES